MYNIAAHEYLIANGYEHYNSTKLFDSYFGENHNDIVIIMFDGDAAWSLQSYYKIPYDSDVTTCEEMTK